MVEFACERKALIFPILCETRNPCHAVPSHQSHSYSYSMKATPPHPHTSKPPHPHTSKPPHPHISTPPHPSPQNRRTPSHGSFSSLCSPSVSLSRRLSLPPSPPPPVFLCFFLLFQRSPFHSLAMFSLICHMGFTRMCLCVSKAASLSSSSHSPVTSDLSCVCVCVCVCTCTRMCACTLFTALL